LDLTPTGRQKVKPIIQFTGVKLWVKKNEGLTKRNSKNRR
jgi:hypothetical protein